MRFVNEAWSILIINEHILSFLLKRNQQFFSPEYIKCINELKSICYAVEKS